MRIFLDANILFSAARTDGAIRTLLALLEAAGHELWADAYVVEEARRNLIAKAPAGIAVLDRLEASIFMSKVAVGKSAHPGLEILPEKDRPVLAAAIHCRCTALVTGDRSHFGALYGKTIQGVSVYSPALLAEALLN